MHNSEVIISNLLTNKFGEINAQRAVGLVDQLINEDVLISGKKVPYLENLLSVKKTDIDKTLNFLYKLAETSYFAAAFFIEKIQLLYFYDLFDDYITLLSLTRHYSSRSAAYALGSSDLISNDLENNVKTIDSKFYRKIISILINRHEDLEILSLHIARYIGKIFTLIEERHLNQFIEDCITIKNSYTKETAIAYLDNIQNFHTYVPLKKTKQTFSKLNGISRQFLMFSISYPEIINASENKQKLYKNIHKLKIDILKKDDFTLINSYPQLLQDEYFLALLRSWKKYPRFHKKNILQQLESLNYKRELLSNPNIKEEINKVNKITNNNWLTNWAFANKQIDNKFVYEEIRKILLPSCYFNFNTKKIYNLHKKLFESIKKDSKTDDLITLIKYLKKICIDKEIITYLDQLKKYLVAPTDLFLKKYSQNNLFVKTWDRDPWFDYARSDELYACTSIGEATDLYAPVYLADLNTNNLDVYNNNLRIGRMHFFIVRDVKDEVILLFDCIDGSDRLMRNETRLNYLLESIQTYAKYLGISRIFFNTDLMFNNTPKLFVRFLKSKFKSEEVVYVKRFLETGSQKKLMHFPLTSFSESLKDKNEGLIKGFLTHSV